MWVPYVDAVVVVTCNPVGDRDPPDVRPWNGAALRPLVELLGEIDPEAGDVSNLSFADLRDKLLAFDPLNVDHVKRVNRAEADFWRKTVVSSAATLRARAQLRGKPLRYMRH